MNTYNAILRPTLWRRISMWHRWPWLPKLVIPEYPVSGYTTIVKQNGRPIACHHDKEQPWGFGVRLDRWACLYGLLGGHLAFDFQVTRTGPVGTQTMRDLGFPE